VSDLDPNTGHQVIRVRPFKVSADRVEIRVSPRVGEGITRLFLNEHGGRGGCTSIGVYLNDEQRRDLIAVLTAQEPPVSSQGTPAPRPCTAKGVDHDTREIIDCQHEDGHSGSHQQGDSFWLAGAPEHVLAALRSEQAAPAPRQQWAVEHPDIITTAHNSEHSTLYTLSKLPGGVIVTRPGPDQPWTVETECMCVTVPDTGHYAGCPAALSEAPTHQAGDAR
jgi:hypothetical protein